MSARDDKAIERVNAMISANIRQKMDEAFSLAAFGGTTAYLVNSTPSKGLTLDVIRKAALLMPKRHTWLQSRWFPDEAAIQFEGPSDHYMLAGAGFWRDFHYKLLNMSIERRTSATANPFQMRMDPDDIDPRPDDSDYRVKDKRRIWDGLIEDMKVALVEVPDWLRAKRAAEDKKA